MSLHRLRGRISPDPSNLIWLIPAEGFEAGGYFYFSVLNPYFNLEWKKRTMRICIRILSGFLMYLGVCGMLSGVHAANLTIYTYDSFVSEWGPGPKIKESFEKKCDCTLSYVALTDAAGLLSRLQLEGENSPADIVLGLDTHLMAQARATNLFVPHQQDMTSLKMPVSWTDKVFLPFDYGYFAFVYDTTRLQTPPTSLKELVESQDSPTIIIQDPRSSTPGLGLLHWVKAVYGDQAHMAWQKLEPKVVTVTKGWSEAYGLFLKEQADMVLSYTTSPAYHETAENEKKYSAASFSEGHVMQIEVAAQLKTAPQPELAQQFMAHILSSDFQDVIPTTNWMFPVTNRPEALPASYKNLITPVKTLVVEEGKSQKKWVQEWREGLSQ